MNQEDLVKLANSIATEQDVDDAFDEARVLAEYDVDILSAAVEWAKTGVMPAAPEIEGQTPRSLHEDYYPTQTFSILTGLRKHPEQTKRALKHLPGRQDFGPDERSPNVQFGQLYTELYLLAADARSLHNEAIATGLASPLVLRLEQHSLALAAARDKLKDDLSSRNYVLKKELPQQKG
jgi:hypothetical protein